MCLYLFLIIYFKIMEISKDLLEYARGISEKIIFFAIKVVLFITIVKFILAHPYQISYYVNNFSIVRLILAMAIILKIPKSIVFKICAILLLFWLEQWNTYLGFEDVGNKVMLLPKFEQPSTRLFWKSKLNFCVVFHDKIPLFILCNFEKALTAEIRILTNGFLWACKNHEMCEPLVFTYSELKMEKIVSSQDQKNSWNQMFIQFHEKTWDMFFPNFSSLHGIFSTLY